MKLLQLSQSISALVMALGLLVPTLHAQSSATENAVDFISDNLGFIRVMAHPMVTHTNTSWTQRYEGSDLIIRLTFQYEGGAFDNGPASSWAEYQFDRFGRFRGVGEHSFGVYQSSGVLLWAFLESWAESIDPDDDPVGYRLMKIAAQNSDSVGFLENLLKLR